MKFTPTDGRLTLNQIDGIEMLTIDISFSELMDPNEPNGKEHASASIDCFFPEPDRFDLSDLSIPGSLNLERETEGAIYYLYCHNPVYLHQITFGQRNTAIVETTLVGEIDFTYEGLSALGKADFIWKVGLSLADL